MDRRVLKRVQSVQYYGTINRCAIIGANYDKCPGRADESVPRGLFFQVEHGAVGKPRGANIAPSRTPSDSLLHASRSESGCRPLLQRVLYTLCYCCRGTRRCDSGHFGLAKFDHSSPRPTSRTHALVRRRAPAYTCTGAPSCPLHCSAWTPLPCRAHRVLAPRCRPAARRLTLLPLPFPDIELLSSPTISRYALLIPDRQRERCRWVTYQ